MKPPSIWRKAQLKIGAKAIFFIILALVIISIMAFTILPKLILLIKNIIKNLF